MKTTTSIWLDKNIVGIIVRLVNYLVIILGKLLNINHNLNKSFKVIAVCKYKGMGSIIQSTPLLKTLREQYPKAKIIYISSKENIEILKQIHEIDEIIIINDTSIFKLLASLFPFIKKLISKRIEVYIDLEVYSNFSTLITILSKAKNRMGFYLNSMHYRMGNYTHMMFYNTRSPISETYLQFARLLNCKSIIKDIVSLDNKISNIKISKNISFNLINEKYIVINPNASDLRIERRWSGNNFVKLILLINKKYPSYKLLLIGSPNEAMYVEDILNKIGDKKNIFSIAGKTNIPELISTIKHASLFISNDSGPLHIAYSTKTPTIALFGPCSPNQYGNNKNCIIAYANLYCSPCVHEFVSPPCKGNNLCMKAISVDSVFQKVIILLDEININHNVKEKKMIFKLDNFTIGALNR